MGRVSGMVKMILNGLNSMITLYKYIFYKAHYVCVNIIKEREFPWFFGAFVVSMVFVGNIITLVQLLRLYFLPSKLHIGGCYGYFSLFSLVVFAVVLKNNNLYKEVLKDVESLHERKRGQLKYVSLVYILLVFFALFYLGYLHRENAW